MLANCQDVSPVDYGLEGNWPRHVIEITASGWRGCKHQLEERWVIRGAFMRGADRGPVFRPYAHRSTAADGESGNHKGGQQVVLPP